MNDTVLFDAWAKLDEQGLALPLEAHAGDVATVLQRLLCTEIWIGRLEQCAGRALTDLDVSRLCSLGFLHDLGKVNHGFWRQQFDRTTRVGHTSETAPVFLVEKIATQPAARHLLDLIEAWGALPLFPAILAHHGRPLEIYACSGVAARSRLQADRRQIDHWIAHDGYDPLGQLAQLLDHARRRFPAAHGSGPPLPNTAAFISLFCGLLTLADWLGSDTALFPIAEPHGAGREALQRSAADQAVSGRGLDDLPTPPCSFATAFVHTPRGLQTMADDPELGTVALLEAETGSGKTEAALWRWLALRRAGVVDGLYFALPTRSAAVQLHGRVQSTLYRVFGVTAPEAVLAVPGYLRAGDAEGQALPNFKVTWSTESDGDGRWAAERPKRFLAARVAVGTIDQALMAGLQLRHAHLRAACLSRSLLVVDEVHASDAFMGGVLEQVIANHRLLGGHALLLSATLAAEARSRLLGHSAAPSFTAACAMPYPALSGTGRELITLPPSELCDRSPGKRVALEAWPCIDDAQSVADRAIRAARGGASVLVVRNSVAGAVAVARAVEAAAPELAFRVGAVATLHHGRFSPDDRRLLDAAVEAAFGKGRDRRGRMLCGTQTLEQSLDLDADLLITDLAPMDVLLQRIGRLHRHLRTDRDQFGQPRAIVLVPTERDLSTFLGRVRYRHGLGPRKDGTGTYPDLLVLEATLRLIENNATIDIPADNRRLVEGALHSEMLDRLATELGVRWVNHAAGRAGSQHAERGQARHWALNLSAPFETLLFPNQDEIIATRLGLRDRLVDFDPPFAGPFEQAVRRLSVPGWMARTLPVEIDVSVEGQDEEGTRLRIGPSHFRYGRMGLEIATETA